MTAVDAEPPGAPVIGVVINEGKQLGDGLDAFRSRLADLGHPDPPWFEVPKSRHAPDKIRALVTDRGVDRLLMWGGDGTVRRAIHTLLDMGRDDVTIGILPAGTANLLARNLDIPIELDAATVIAVNAPGRPIDVGVVNGRHFGLMAGAGFDAHVMRDADAHSLKKRFGRLGYVIAGVRRRNSASTVLEIDVDGEPWYRGPSKGMIVANVSTIIGGLEAFPGADPTDGRLDVGVIRTENLLEWSRLIGRAATGRATSSPFASFTTGRRITLATARPLRWEVDGGDRSPDDHFVFECLPAAIRIARP